MKNFFNVLLVSVLCVGVVVACSDLENSVGQTEEDLLIYSENLNPVFSAKGGDMTISFKAASDWKAVIVNSRADDWMCVTPAAGGKGDSEIVISAKPNDTPDELNATVFLKCRETTVPIVVVQKQKNALTVTSNRYSVSGQGGQITVEVMSNVSFDVEIRDSWIKRVGTRGLSSSELMFSIASNDTENYREGLITIHSGELSEQIRIYQNPDDFIVLSGEEFMIPAAGGTVDVEVRSTVDYAVKGVPDWMTEIKTRSVSTHSLHFMVSENETYDAREAEIIFYDKANEQLADTIVVFQAYKGAILVAQTSYDVQASGQLLSLAFQSNVDFEITVDVDWIERAFARSMQENTVSFWILVNDGSPREGHITITPADGGTPQIITVNQDGGADYHKKLERDALIAFYNATGGPSWTNNENWCTGADISTWYGVKVGDVHVTQLSLYNNNLSGNIPEEIGDLKSLQNLQLANNHLRGEIPDGFYSLTELWSAYLQDNELEGTLSEKIGQLTTLARFCFSRNNIEGPLPAGLSKLVGLVQFDPMLNRLSGQIPAEVLGMPNWDVIEKTLEPQQSGYRFTAPATKAMIDIGDNFYLHPDGLTVEYRQSENKAITYDEMKPLLQKMYTKLNDDFDFVISLYNVGNMEEIAGEQAGQFIPVNTDIQGIGRDICNDSADFGSDGNLKGLVFLSSRRAIEGVLLHELMHYWGAPDLGQWSLDLDGVAARSPVHWGISSVDGLLGGFKLSTLQRNVDGNPEKYRASCSDTDWCFATENSSSYYYAPLELYLMGLIPPEEVPDTYIYDGISGNPAENPYTNGIFYAKTERKLTIQDIIGQLGERVPDYRDSQKNFRALTLVITKEPVDDREWLIIEDDILRMQKQDKSGYEYTTNFYEATGGRAVLKMDEIDLSRK